MTAIACHGQGGGAHGNGAAAHAQFDGSAGWKRLQLISGSAA